MSVDYDQLNAELNEAGADIGAAGCHGSLCGALCAPVADEQGWQKGWLEYVLGEALRNRALAVQTCTRSMLALFAVTQRSLTNEDFQFQPLLPEDGASLKQRAIALADWCDGFVFGVGLVAGMAGKSKTAAGLPDNVAEVLKDFMEISRVASETAEVEGGEEEDAAYYELLEYVRVAAMLLFAERPEAKEAEFVGKASAPKAPPPGSTLH